MSFQTGANLAGATGTPTRPENVEIPFITNRNPTPMDWDYPLGKRWLNVGNSLWVLFSILGQSGINTANWVEITTSSGGILSILGTANQITATNSAGVVTLSIPATFIAPGSIASTTTMSAGTALSSGTTITAGTSITATLGNITATNGNLSLATAGNKILIATGTNASAGTTAALTAGAIVVSTTAITANSLVFFATNALGTVTIPQSYRVSARTPGTSFTIQSSDATDTSTVNYWILN
jgi:hypothetical protein